MRYKRIVLLLFVLFLFSGCQMSPKQKKPKYEVKAVKESKLKYDHMYIKHQQNGKYVFYDIPLGWASYGEDSEPTGELSETLFFGKNTTEKQIPTLYKDDTLIFKTEQDIDSEMMMNRFLDKGYTVPIRGFEQTNIDSFIMSVSRANLLPDSNLYKQVVQSGLQTDDRLTLSSCDKPCEIELKTGCLHFNGNFSEATLILFKGTDNFKVKTKLDARLFEMFETYQTKKISYDEDGYAVISMNGFKSGYYDIEGLGLFRYVDAPYTPNLDLNTVDYSMDGYEKDEDGLRDTTKYDEYGNEIKEDNKDKEESFSESSHL